MSAVDPASGMENGPVRGAHVVMAPRPAPRPSRLAPFVPYLHIGLPALALVATLLGVVWPLLVAPGGFRLGTVPLAPDNQAYMRMVNPQFSGADQRDRNFNITAKTAVQRDSTVQVFELEQPKADMTTTKGAWVSLTSDTGQFNQHLRTVDLSGNVHLFHDKGYDLTTQEAHIDLRWGSAYGNKPVHGQGPAGYVDSDGFRVADSGDIVEFTGKAHMVLYDSGVDASNNSDTSTGQAAQ